MGALLLLGPWVFEHFATDSEIGKKWQGVILAWTGPLWLVGVQLIATILFVAWRRPGDGVARPDDDREWLARLSAIKLKLMLLWAVAGFAALVLNLLLDRYLANYDMSLSTVLTVITLGRRRSTAPSITASLRFSVVNLPCSARLRSTASFR